MRLLLLLVFSVVISACGGGGSGGDSAEIVPVSSNNGWITIDYQAAHSTSVYLSGEAFVSQDWWRCCSGSAEDTGVTVTWMNTTTGASGPAYQTPDYWCLFSCTLNTNYHDWYATIPLIAGRNDIVMKAWDPGGNIGRASVTVYPPPPPPDTTAPTVVSTSPQSDATGIAINTVLTATFSEQMDPASITTSSIILSDSAGSNVPGSVTYSGTTATYIPTTNLAYSRQYNVLIRSVRDVAGNVLSSDYSWKFITGNAPDTTPPSVRYTTPSNNETCANVDGSISATFSEQIDGATANGPSFFVKNGAGNTVTGTVSSSGSVMNFTPSLGLAYNTPYSATITTDVTDLVGNALGSEYNWIFTTQQSPAGTWQPVTLNGAPYSRSSHSAIWTGTEMIIWGGTSNTGLLDTGGRYNPATDSWQPVSTINAPAARYYHTAVWTGSEMIVWGGIDQNGTYLNNGARYDPSTDTWQPMSTVDAPTARRWHTAVWIGSEMIVWGGDDQNHTRLNTGARYNPILDTWRPVSTIAAPTARSSHTAVWSGLEMIVWGGSGFPTNIGGRYDPVTDTWRAMSSTTAPTSRTEHTAVWTGSEMIVWGGYSGSFEQSGGIYDPATDSWQTTSLTCAPLGRFRHIAFWTGTQMIVWGGRNGTADLNTGGVYDPSSGTWHATQFLGAPKKMYSPAGIWNGSTMIVWEETGGLFTP
jgi:N-acetylneuraminic acid mutarotase